MADNKGGNLGEILKALLIMGVGFLIVFGVSIALGRFKDEPNVSPVYVEVPPPIVKCPSDLDSYASTTKRIPLLENKPSNGQNHSLKGYRVTIKRSGLTSDIACGYLFYKISFGSKPIEQKSMALFMRPTGGQLGGHIWPDEKRGAIIKEINNKTEVLLPLDTITYDGTAKLPIHEVNWALLLNVADEITFDIALSADTPSGNMDGVEIAYKCVNKDTGKETDECKLDISNTTNLITF